MMTRPVQHRPCQRHPYTVHPSTGHPSTLRPPTLRPSAVRSSSSVRRSLRGLLAAAVLACLAPGAALAQLKPGAEAPDFTLSATLAGDAFEFSLSQALRQGPVVLYFYPAAFTKGCTIEAHNFAEAVDEYKSYGASVLGVSADGLEKLKEFSVSACRGKFAVAADPDAKVIQAYDAKMAFRPNMASRVSYVITPDRKIYYEFSSADPDDHVPNTLAAVKQWSLNGKVR